VSETIKSVFRRHRSFIEREAGREIRSLARGRGVGYVIVYAVVLLLGWESTVSSPLLEMIESSRSGVPGPSTANVYLGAAIRAVVKFAVWQSVMNRARKKWLSPAFIQDLRMVPRGFGLIFYGLVSAPIVAVTALSVLDLIATCFFLVVSGGGPAIPALAYVFSSWFFWIAVTLFSAHASSPTGRSSGVTSMALVGAMVIFAFAGLLSGFLLGMIFVIVLLGNARDFIPPVDLASMAPAAVAAIRIITAAVALFVTKDHWLSGEESLGTMFNLHFRIEQLGEGRVRK